MDLLPDADLSPDKLLGIYLQDHLTAATAGVELFRRSAGSQTDSARRPTLHRLAVEVDEDRRTLGGLMDSLGVERPAYRVVAGWAAEKLGRLKLNGTLLRRSPLSDVVELEALRAGVAAKLDLWFLLRHLSSSDERLQVIDYERLLERARAQYDELDGLHLVAGEALRR